MASQCRPPLESPTLPPEWIIRRETRYRAIVEQAGYGRKPTRTSRTLLHCWLATLPAWLAGHSTRVALQKAHTQRYSLKGSLLSLDVCRHSPYQRAKTLLAVHRVRAARGKVRVRGSSRRRKPGPDISSYFDRLPPSPSRLYTSRGVLVAGWPRAVPQSKNNLALHRGRKKAPRPTPTPRTNGSQALRFSKISLRLPNPHQEEFNRHTPPSFYPSLQPKQNSSSLVPAEVENDPTVFPEEVLLSEWSPLPHFQKMNFPLFSLSFINALPGG